MFKGNNCELCNQKTQTENSPHVSVQHGAGVERGKSATVGGLLGGVQLERLGGTAWERGEGREEDKCNGQFLYLGSDHFKC